MLGTRNVCRFHRNARDGVPYSVSRTHVVSVGNGLPPSLGYGPPRRIFDVAGRAVPQSCEEPLRNMAILQSRD